MICVFRNALYKADEKPSKENEFFLQYSKAALLTKKALLCSTTPRLTQLDFVGL